VSLPDDYDPALVPDGPPTRDLKPLREKPAESAQPSRPPRLPGSMIDLEVERFLDLPLSKRDQST
jgi:hypothetical protein